MRLSRDPFEWWYSAGEIARRLGKHPRTIKRAMESGAFGSRPGEAGFAGRFVCGEWHLPWPAVARFLKIDADNQAASASFRVRSEAELRRQVTTSKRMDGGAVLASLEVPHG